MTQFKGTFGKWCRYRKTDNHIVEAVLSDNYDVICSLFHNTQQIEYDALLISKAPELLEMLEEFCNINPSHPIKLASLMDKAEQLIKEATEL